MSGDVDLAIAEGVATITLNRPDNLNAFTESMLHELIATLDAADANDDAAVVIVTGAGRAFSAGADLSAGGSTFDAREAREVITLETHRDGAGLVTLRLFEMNKPVIAAINGAAVGMGVTITLAMDVRLASEAAKFGFVFARRGLVPEGASSWFLPRIVGVARAQEWVCTGRVFGAEEALGGGLVRSVHPPDELLPAANALAREIADNAAPVSVALARQMLWRMLGAPHPMHAHKVDSMAIFSRGQTADVREGVESFLEKRPPRFPLRVSKDMPEFFPWWDPVEFPARPLK